MKIPAFLVSVVVNAPTAVISGSDAKPVALASIQKEKGLIAV